ncbi:hypothetical protein EGJ27_07305 [Pseudomonas sp. v388]|uniref:hypothetical protein n=1 Tax=Pseudomonas sp. v388 TaxID=2479849 RepID=UPI000F77A4AA|nr:hypothetical protein [Pseudomonas sp. v388]RRV09562.1 hypothetical protein EGJ27_07305 [Pseudomonas sp. v388]
MKLIPSRYASIHERDHAYPALEAQALVGDSLNTGVPLDGMDNLRGDLMSSRDEDVMVQLEKGEWLLVKDQAYHFDWGRFDKAAQEQKTAQRVRALSRKPLPEKTVEKFVALVQDSITGEPLANRKVRFVMGQESSVRKTDSLGVAYLSPAPPPQSIAMLQIHLAD